MGRCDRDGAADMVEPTRPVVCAVADRDVERLLGGVPEIELVAVARSARSLLAGDRLPGEATVLVVSDSTGDPLPALAAALARWAPYVTVVVLVASSGRLLDLHAEYLAVAATDPRGDPRARVHAVSGPLTVDRLRRVLTRHLSERPGLARDDGVPPADRRVRYAALRRPPGGRTVLVQACVGGAGASTVAAVLAAAAVQREPGRKVCVVELTGGADSPGSLGVADLALVAARAPAFMSRLGVSVLTRAAIDEAGGLTADAAPRLVETLHRRFDLVVADCASSWPETSDLCAADAVLFVTTLSVASLRGLDHRTRVLTAARDSLRAGVVVNGAFNGVGVDPQQVLAAAHGAPIVAAVPFAAREVLIAGNTERLDLLLEHPDLGPVYRRLADHCVPPIELGSGPITPSPGRRRRSRGRRRASIPAGVLSPFVVEPGHGRAAG